MGHAVEIGVVNKRKEIIPFAEEFAYYNGDRQEGSDRYCPSQMTIKDIYFDSLKRLKSILIDSQAIMMIERYSLRIGNSRRKRRHRKTLRRRFQNLLIRLSN